MLCIYLFTYFWFCVFNQLFRFLSPFSALDEMTMLGLLPSAFLSVAFALVFRSINFRMYRSFVLFRFSKSLMINQVNNATIPFTAMHLTTSPCTNNHNNQFHPVRNNETCTTRVLCTRARSCTFFSSLQKRVCVLVRLFVLCVAIGPVSLLLSIGSFFLFFC